MRKASVGQRVLASIIDLVVVSPITGYAAWRTWETGDAGWAWVGFGAVGIYTIVLTALRGQTVGKMVTGCRVVMDEAGTTPVPCTWSGSVIRYAVLSLPGVVPVIGGLLGLGVVVWALFGMATDDLGRGIQDTAAGTRVLDLRARGALTDRFRAAQPKPEPRPRPRRRRSTWQP